jgi:hypothetical protein
MEKSKADSQRPSETALAYPYVVCELDDRHRVILCPDGLQWIAQTLEGGRRWRNQRFFRTRQWLDDYYGPHPAIAALPPFAGRPSCAI